MNTPGVPEVVVGAGILGCALARELALRTAGRGEILVLDGNPIASQASARSAALLSLARPWARRHWVPLIQHTLATVEALRDEGFDIPLHRCGALHVAASDAARTVLADHQATAAVHGIDSLVEAPQYFADRLPWLDCAAFEQGVWFPEEAYTDPYLLTGAYAASARRRGVRFEIGKAARLEADGDRVRLHADGRSWIPQRLWIVAGAWTNALLAPLGSAAPYAAVRSQYWITQATELAPTLMPMLLAPDLKLYARRELGSILFGLRETPGTAADPRTLAPDLAGFAFDQDNDMTAPTAAYLPLARLAPRLMQLGLRHHVSGPSGYSPDGDFAAGPLAPWSNLQILGACNGSGIAVSAGLARVAADIAEGQAAAELVDRLAPGRFGRFDPWSAEWIGRCIAAREAKRSG